LSKGKGKGKGKCGERKLKYYFMVREIYTINLRDLYYAKSVDQKNMRIQEYRFMK
jgi:hypothetical protein